MSSLDCWLTERLPLQAAHHVKAIVAIVRRCRSKAELLMVRDTVYARLACIIFDTFECERVTDELLERALAVGVVNVDADCDDDDCLSASPTYDEAFPPLYEESTTTLGVDTAYLSPEYIEAPRHTEAHSFDGSMQPHFVVPKQRRAPRAPVLPDVSLVRAARLGAGCYVPPPRVLAGPRRQRYYSVGDTSIMSAPFCVPRIECGQPPASQQMLSSSLGATGVAPIDGRTHFAPIRSDSMSWAYCDSGSDSTMHEKSEMVPLARPLASRPRTPEGTPPLSLDAKALWEAAVQAEAVGTDNSAVATAEYNSTASAEPLDASCVLEEWLETEQLLSLVGGIASARPLPSDMDDTDEPMQ